MAAPRRHLALVCFLHQAWRNTLDQAVDMYGKLLDRNRLPSTQHESGRYPYRAPCEVGRGGAFAPIRSRNSAAVSSWARK